MAILSALSLTDVADLRSEATAFQQHADQLKQVTDQMLSEVSNTIGVWKGDAQTSYSKQFEGLSDDMQRIYEQCVEYSDDLLNIAQNYESAESNNVSTASALKADIELT